MDWEDFIRTVMAQILRMQNPESYVYHACISLSSQIWSWIFLHLTNVLFLTIGYKSCVDRCMSSSTTASIQQPS